MATFAKSVFFFLVVLLIRLLRTRADLGVTANDPCSPNPCWNAGVCSSNGTSFICRCQQGYSGGVCELRSTDCQVNPCVHGICRRDKAGSPECFCIPGYTGEHCDTDEDDCASGPCRNGALCFDEVNGYRCVCQGDTYGHNCEIHKSHIEECVTGCDEQPCWRNSSAVVSTAWGYGDSICSTLHSCFGGKNDTASNVYDKFVEVQLKPIQIQVGDTLNITADHEIIAYVGGFVPHHVVAANGSNAFLSCNESNGIPLVNKPTNSSVIVDSEILRPGMNYFIANIDSTFRCHFGLRLNVSVKENKCKQPASSEICSGRGQCTTNFSLPDFRCKCCGGFRGEYCEKIDYCFSKPCKNNAVCQNIESPVGNRRYVCICQSGYEGRDCSRIINMCLSSPCQNGAQCIPKVNDFTCVCPKGYSGRNCESEIDECASDPCINGGTCVDGVASFVCQCPAGYTGFHCEVDINECSPSPCVHGVCIDQVNSFNCRCLPGYGGVKCDYNLNECLSNPCHNGGICVDEVNSYRCDCGVGFRGDHCEVDIDLCTEPNMCVNSLSCTDKGQGVECICQPGFEGENCAVNINDCQPNPCYNGGTCKDKVNDFECICQEGFSGKRCQEIATSWSSQWQFSLKLITEDCYRLQGSPTNMSDIYHDIVLHMAEACNCSATPENMVDKADVMCRDTINAEVGINIKSLPGYSTEELTCKFVDLLNQHKNVIDLGHNTHIVNVLSDVSCNDQSREKVSPADSKNPKDGENNKATDKGNIAVTVASLCAAVGLIVAAIIVCLKCRRSRPPIKKKILKDENELIDNLSADLLSAVAPTPKSMYRTSGGYHNMAFSGRFNPENPVKSRRV